MGNIKDLFTKSDGFKDEYSARVTRIGQLHPIPKADRLALIYVGSDPVVIRKDQIKSGECYFYVPRETTLAEKFMFENNLYSVFHYEQNSNAAEVGKILEEAKRAEGEEKEKLEAEARAKCGIFNRNRVRVAKLRGQDSAGFLFGMEDILKWKPELKDRLDGHSIDELDGIFFDTVDEDLFCKAYVPKPTRRSRRGGSRRIGPVEYRVNKYFKWLPESWKKAIIKKYEKPRRSKSRKAKFGENCKYLIPDKFVRHYDTTQISSVYQHFKPEDVVDISKKIHGTSFFVGNVLRNYPDENAPKSLLRRNALVKALHLPKSWIKEPLKEDYGYIYSSRNCIQTQDINPNAKVYEGMDAYSPYGKLFEEKDLLPKGMTIYGEIFGYCNGKGIQGEYDYGCKPPKDDFPGENKLMIYRITTEDESGHKTEWEISDVIKWTEDLVQNNPDIKEKIFPLQILYHGTLKDLFPELDTTQHWHENLIVKLKTYGGLEGDEPLCKNKVPMEGLCLRLNNSPTPSCVKLKSDRFYAYEAGKIDRGELDVEMISEYGDVDSDDSEDFSEDTE